MLSPYDELYDPYTGKRKRGAVLPEPPKLHRRRRGCACLVLVLAGFALFVGLLAGGLIVGVEALERSTHQTRTAQAELTQAALNVTALPSPLPPTATATTIPHPSATPSPTAGAVLATALEPSPTPTRRSPSATPAPSSDEPNSRFDFFAQTQGFPQNIRLSEVTCTEQATTFTLRFEAWRDENLTSLEVTFTADGRDAALAQIRSAVPPDAVFSQDLFVVINEEQLNLKGITAAEVQSRIEAAIERLRPQSVTQFSLTWLETEKQPSLSFAMRGLHLSGGGVLMTVRWGRSPNDDMDSHSVQFLVCE